MEVKIEMFKRIISSCFTYGGADKGSYNYKRYLVIYESILGTELFNEIYDTYLTHLKENFTITENVYTDSEGCTYNELTPKK